MSSTINEATIKVKRGSASSATSNNITLNQGEWGLETDTGNMKIGDGTTAWNDLEYRQQLPFTNDLTSGNITHTLPKVTGFPQTESIYWENGGTFKLTLAVTNSETVGGLAAGTWEGEGEGHMLLESDGSNWQVREYEDSGSNANGEYQKYLDGILECWSEVSKNNAIATAQTFTHAHSFQARPIGSLLQNDGNAGSMALSGSVPTTTQYSIILYSSTGGGATGAVRSVGVRYTGRWRT